MRSSAHGSGFPLAASLAAVAAGLVAASCGDAPTRSSERFCGELSAHLTEIQTPPESDDAVPAFITLFSKMGEVAPLDVQSDWEAIYTSLKTADTVDVADPASMQAVADATIASHRSYEAVVDWAKRTCNLDIGPIGIVSGGAEIATTTTADPASETTVSGG